MFQLAFLSRIYIWRDRAGGRGISPPASLSSCSQLLTPEHFNLTLTEAKQMSLHPNSRTSDQIPLSRTVVNCGNNITPLCKENLYANTQQNIRGYNATSRKRHWDSYLSPHRSHLPTVKRVTPSHNESMNLNLPGLVESNQSFTSDSEASLDSMSDREFDFNISRHVHILDVAKTLIELKNSV
ncbi:hypothetical protein K7432_011785 [Basidiobolus ranarum]|uniref:Uncharacterized protein n=1 Tax=Basidiobolus ranarum TaxID=34480 RepID=A0ABR2WLV5_9FUNG